MSDCFERLPLWARVKLFVPPGHKDWKQCQSCNVYKSMASLKKCAACSEFRLRAIYYCSKECQRQDWPKHKVDCKIFREQKINLPGMHSYGMTKEIMDFMRVPGEWEFVNSQTVNWCMKLAYHYNPSIDPLKVIFDVTIDVETFQILSFTFTSKNLVEGGKFFAAEQFQALQGPENHWYRILGSFRGEKDPMQSIHRCLLPPKRKHGRDIDSDFPEWPWIAAHLTRKQDHSVFVASKKWNLLITAVEWQRKHHRKFFADFVAPKMEVNHPLKVERMDEWYKKMGEFDPWAPLVASGYMERTLNRKLTE